MNPLEEYIIKMTEDIDEMYEWDGITIDWDVNISTDDKYAQIRCVVDYPLQPNDLILSVALHFKKSTINKVKKEICNSIDILIRNGAKHYGY